MSFFNLFTKHPNSINETYLQHLRFAIFNGTKMMFSGLACVIHGLLPFLFVNTASDTVKKLYRKIMNRQKK